MAQVRGCAPTISTTYCYILLYTSIYYYILLYILLCSSTPLILVHTVAQCSSLWSIRATPRLKPTTPRYSVYLLYWYKSTNTDRLPRLKSFSDAMTVGDIYASVADGEGAQFTCFTSTEVQNTDTLRSLRPLRLTAKSRSMTYSVYLLC